MSRRNTFLGLAAITALALLLRVWGLTFGLPYAYHVDEAVFTGIAKDANESNFAALPPNFSAFQLSVALEHRVLTLVEPVVRALPLSPELIATLNAPGERYNLIARVQSAVLGAATVIPVFLLGRRFWGAPVGWIGAILMATAFMPVRDSHFGVPDALATFLTLSATAAAARLSEEARTWRYLLAGVLAGMAVASKQLTWPVFLLVVLFHLSAPSPRRWFARLFDMRLIDGLVLGVVVYLACVPQMVLRWDAFKRYWQAASSMGALGGLDRQKIEAMGPAATYLDSLRWGLGEAVCWLGIAGIVWGMVRGPWQLRTLWLFPLIFFAFLLKPGHMFFARYTMAALPFLVLAAASMIWLIVKVMPISGAARAAVTVVLVALAVEQPLVSAVRFDRLMTQPDTRTLAKQWIEQNVPEGSRIMMEFLWFSPALSSAQQPVPFSTRSYEVGSRGAYGLSDLSDGFGPSKGVATVNDYIIAGYHYIVTNSFSRDSDLLDPKENAAKHAFYAELEEQAEMLKEFSPYKPGRKPRRIFAEAYAPAIELDAYERPGPVLRIYRLRRSPFM